MKIERRNAKAKRIKGPKCSKKSEKNNRSHKEIFGLNQIFSKENFEVTTNLNPLVRVKPKLYPHYSALLSTLLP